ncbi:hypothetical protein HMPREF1210_01110 [Paenisporosarcina sp. HGH0030]|uniref:hypothetical protein n=1 Tax=Paenisporosarcina sp. HGH0030 TaxID=1078085 RepID=UPI00034E0705|nr:hypothetical protein [Paenisporosarcina sp. HGH0030]EPD52730.1 hypothetical protein HMPREF1210_01110 [Paenisporosarcina sp. HGH0030]
MSSTRMNKTVSFNLTDELDIKMLEHAEKLNPISNKKRNFSKYVKKLIEEDIRREKFEGSGGTFNFEKTSKESPVDDRPDAYTMEAMGSFL